jgi:hypothetical protein
VVDVAQRVVDGAHPPRRGPGGVLEALEHDLAAAAHLDTGHDVVVLGLGQDLGDAVEAVDDRWAVGVDASDPISL